MAASSRFSFGRSLSFWGGRDRGRTGAAAAPGEGRQYGGRSLSSSMDKRRTSYKKILPQSEFHRHEAAVLAPSCISTCGAEFSKVTGRGQSGGTARASERVPPGATGTEHADTQGWPRRGMSCTGQRVRANGSRSGHQAKEAILPVRVLDRQLTMRIVAERRLCPAVTRSVTTALACGRARARDRLCSARLTAGAVPVSTRERE